MGAIGAIVRQGVLVSAVALGGLAVIGGCGGGGSSPGVASLAGRSAAARSTSATTKPSQKSTEEAYRSFARCMREHGVDMADPKTDGKGGNVISIGNSGAPVDKAKVDAAQQACQHFIDTVVQGNARDRDPAQEAKMRDRALKFARCMREHGVNMPDPQFQSGGRMTQQFTTDPNNPNFQRAQNACSKDLPKGGRGGKGFSVNSGSGSSSGSGSLQTGGL